MPKVFTKGLDQFHYAPLRSDEEGVLSYDTPKRLKDAQNVQVRPTTSTVAVSSDNTTEDFIETSGAEITVQITSLQEGDGLLLLNRKKLSNGIIVSGAPQYAAFGYRRTFSNGTERLIWILKTIFQEPEDNVNTAERGNVNPQYDTVTGTSTIRTADKEWRFMKNSTSGGFADEEVKSFFSKATLETFATAASTTYGQPADVEIVAELPATGTPGIVYIVATSGSTTTHYWDGTQFVEITAA